MAESDMRCIGAVRREWIVAVDVVELLEKNSGSEENGLVPGATREKHVVATRS